MSLDDPATAKRRDLAKPVSESMRLCRILRSNVNENATKFQRKYSALISCLLNLPFRDNIAAHLHASATIINHRELFQRIQNSAKSQ